QLRREAGGVGEVARGAVQRGRAQAPRSAQLLEEALDRALERRKRRKRGRRAPRRARGAGGDRGHALFLSGEGPPGVPPPLPCGRRPESTSAMRVASAALMPARRAISSAETPRSAATEPKALSSAARRAGPTPGT